MHTSNQYLASSPSQTQCGIAAASAAPQEQPRPRALLLACGNPLREDDGVGLRIAEAVEKAIPATQVRIIATQQWTPEMTTEIATTKLVIFVDANAADEPGVIHVARVAARAGKPETHVMDPAALLELADSLYGRMPEHAFLLTVGASAFGYGERLSHAVRRAIPKAVRLVANLMNDSARELLPSD